jgi:hypothetical protein
MAQGFGDGDKVVARAAQYGNAKFFSTCLCLIDAIRIPLDKSDNFADLFYASSFYFADSFRVIMLAGRGSENKVEV